MSLARAFTKRSKRPADLPESVPSRAMSTRKPGQAINRNLISSPVELISTTNTLAYNAPDLPNPSLRHISTSTNSSTSSLKKRSMDDSDMNLTSPDLTDASSIDSGSPTSPKPNHLSSYFAAANTVPSTPAVPPTPTLRGGRRSASTTSLSAKGASMEASPAIPQRARAHSKTAHEQLARQRSMHSMHASPRGSQDYRTSREQRASTEIFRAAVPEVEVHPFGKELAQLNEIAEEFGGVVAAVDMDEDMIFMRNHGLSKFTAVDYLSEIQPLFGGMFTPYPSHGRRHRQPPQSQSIPDSYGWI